MHRALAVASIGCALCAALVSRDALAQDLGGTFRIASDRTTVQIPEWGADCGPRPESRSGSTGRQVTVTADGSQLTIQDGRRRLRTDGCWSDNPRVRRLTSSGGGRSWTIRCATPDAEYQRESSEVAISAETDRIQVRETAQYSWQLRESRCRATMTRTISYDRVGQAVTPPAPDVVVVVARPDVVTTPPANRCATPGIATRIELVPARRALTPGGRACFRARALDANRCETPLPAGASVSWQITRATGAATARDAVLEEACVRAPADSPVATYAIVATAGALTARGEARVVSAEELGALVAQHFEDETDDAGAALAAPTAPLPGAGVGSAPVPAPTRPNSANGRSVSPAVWVLVGLAVVLVVAAVLLLTGRKKPARGRDSFSSLPPSDPSNVSGRLRRDAVQISARELPIAAGLVPPTYPADRPRPDMTTVPLPRVTVERPPSKSCPACGKLYTHENAFCPDDGTTLIDAQAGVDDAARPGVAAAASNAPMAAAPAEPAPICPACGLAVDGGATICPRDGTPVGRDAQPLRCPVCQRRFAIGTAFCGEDGSKLVTS